MGNWWGPKLHRDHEARILAQLKQLASHYRCPQPTCSTHVRFAWLSHWEQHRDGHGRIRVVIDCFSAEVFNRFDLDVGRDGELILPQALPIAA